MSPTKSLDQRLRQLSPVQMTPAQLDRVLKPGRDERPEPCQICHRAHSADGKKLEIQFSLAAQAWTCCSCHLRAQRVVWSGVRT